MSDRIQVQRQRTKYVSASDNLNDLIEFGVVYYWGDSRPANSTLSGMSMIVLPNGWGLTQVMFGPFGDVLQMRTYVDGTWREIKQVNLA